MNSKNSLTLTIKSAFWGLVVVALLFIPKPSPWPLIIMGALLGAVGGIMQDQILTKTPNALDADGPIEQNPALFASKQGKGYIAFFWGCSLAFIILSLLLGINWLVGYFAGIAAYEVARGLLVFKKTGTA